MPIDIDPTLEALRGVKGFLGTIKDFTETQVDDKLYALLDLALKNKGFIDLIRLLVNDPEVVATNGASSEHILGVAEQHIDASLIAAADDVGISLTTLLKYLPILVKLLMTLLNQQKA